MLRKPVLCVSQHNFRTKMVSIYLLNGRIRQFDACYLTSYEFSAYFTIHLKQYFLNRMSFGSYELADVSRHCSHFGHRAHSQQRANKEAQWQLTGDGNARRLVTGWQGGVCEGLESDVCNASERVAETDSC